MAKERRSASSNRLGSDPLKRKTGLGWIGEGAKETPSVPKEAGSDSRRGLQPGYKRHTFIVRKEHYKALKLLAVRDDTNMYDELEEALTAHFEKKGVTP